MKYLILFSIALDVWWHYWPILCHQNGPSHLHQYRPSSIWLIVRNASEAEHIPQGSQKKQYLSNRVENVDAALGPLSDQRDPPKYF